MLVVAHWHWGVIGTLAAAQQQGFCMAILLGCWRWHFGGAAALSLHWCRCASVGGEGPDNQLFCREGGGGSGEGKVQHDKQYDKETGNMRLGQKLSKCPRDLYVFWRELDVSLDGGKAARDFTSNKRGGNWYAYSQRKKNWDAVAGLLQMGYTAHSAADRVYETYWKRLLVTMIIDVATIVDKQVGIYRL